MKWVFAYILGFCISLNSEQNYNPSSLPCFLNIFYRIFSELLNWETR